MSAPPRADTAVKRNAGENDAHSHQITMPDSDIAQHDLTVEHAAEALLREHPDALVCALSSNGLIVPIPGSVPLLGQVAIEGRAVIDGVVAADRAEVISLWTRLESELAVNGKVRMLDKPSRWVTLHFLDLRDPHGVMLCVILPSNETAPCAGQDAEELPAAPRFATLLEDEGAKVIECDEAFTQMFGYTPEELIGKSVLDQIHPDDQGRAVEGWLTTLSTRREQLTRLRRRRKDGSWVWVDTTLHNYLNRGDRNYVLVELIDVSAEMVAQEALQEREELLRRLTDAMPVGLMQIDRERNVVYCNTRLAQILNDATEEQREASHDPLATQDGDRPTPSARSLLGTLTREGLASFEAALEHTLQDGVDDDTEVDIVLGGGEWRRALISLRTLRRPNGEISGAITSVLDVTDSARAHQELERRATFDALTGCHNRGAILDLLQRELDRDDAAITGIVYVDLDRFKPVNDSFGHAAGDELLAEVAMRLRSLVRREDCVGRLGGDEFVVLLPDIRGVEVATRVAERVCGSLSSPFELSIGTVELSASVGVACAEAGTLDPDELVKRADRAMYRSKEQADGKPTLDERLPSSRATLR
ncbi:MAG TPA: diguanylate cyclase [Solirubrobacteraceae bacterium]|jgi:diguanylate cyclase (GGDEF)-like protein/PAS domain S-box-containing protein|nr:diguanylate cyclase [Solirubrobacteraceae bacterium]